MSTVKHDYLKKQVKILFPYKWDIYTQNLILVLCIEWKWIFDQWDFKVGGAILHNIPEIETKQLTKCPVAHHRSYDKNVNLHGWDITLSRMKQLATEEDYAVSEMFAVPLESWVFLSRIAMLLSFFIFMCKLFCNFLPFMMRCSIKQFSSQEKQIFSI